MTRLLFLFVFYLLTVNAQSQQKFAPETIKDNDANYKADDFRIKFKTHNYSHALYNAMVYYPQLKNIRFVVVAKKMDMVMRVRPTLLSVVRRPSKRRYKIYINNSAKNVAPTPNSFTFNAQVGIFGHELAHVCDYLNMRFGKLVKTGARYKQPEFKKTLERRTDMLTLESGLGWQLYDYATQWSLLSGEFSIYVEKKKMSYLNSTEMLSAMLTMGYN